MRSETAALPSAAVVGSARTVDKIPQRIWKQGSGHAFVAPRWTFCP
jgi:hypothetical protein